MYYYADVTSTPRSLDRNFQIYHACAPEIRSNRHSVTSQHRGGKFLVNHRTAHQIVTMSAWRQAGLNYINFSNIAAKVLRGSLKAEHKADAIKRDASHIRFTPWVDGKAARSDAAPK